MTNPRFRFLGLVLFVGLLVTRVSPAGEPYLVRDINVGEASSLEGNADEILGVPWNDRFYFVVGDDLWVSDGTEEGSYLLAKPNGVSYLTPTPQHIYFVGQDGSELWLSDGTVDGTHVIKDGLIEIRKLHWTGNLLFFSAVQSLLGRDLWVSGGTTESTYMVADISDHASDSVDPYGLMTLRGHLYFFTDLGTASLYKSDGTEEGTTLVRSFPSASVSNESVTFDRQMYFAGPHTGGLAVWRSDGTTDGTSVLSGTPQIKQLSFLGDQLYFSVESLGFFQCDSQSGSLTKISDVYPGFDDLHHAAVNVNGTLFFNGFSHAYGNELWKSDGTPAGTGMVIDLVEGEWNSNPISFINAEGTLFYLSLDDGNDYRVMKSDGTEAGTRSLFDNEELPGEDASHLTNVNGIVFMGVKTDEFGKELWAYELEGACCYLDSTCADNVHFRDCRSNGGVFQGDESTCQASCSYGMHGDIDNSSWVEDYDHRLFVTCLGVQSTVCHGAFDSNGDQQIDLLDFAVFQSEFTGEVAYDVPRINRD